MANKELNVLLYTPRARLFIVTDRSSTSSRSSREVSLVNSLDGMIWVSEILVCVRVAESFIVLEIESEDRAAQITTIIKCIIFYYERTWKLPGVFRHCPPLHMVSSISHSLMSLHDLPVSSTS